ncbi:phosphoribosylanthranilate isomerase [Flavobacterium sp.]|uniref:phosphoribosylanthranilate isomerase n=1 Tax=Flavobacterium sp. TaxID=239 RepID=UPI003D6BB949
MKLKICGMKYSDNIVEAAKLQPDFMGFIFYDKSARLFDSEIPVFDEGIQKVGVFVNASLDQILNKIKQYDLQLVQLHGEETPEFCDLLKHINVQIIKVFSVDNHFNFNEILPFENVCDYFLFDTKGKLHGGNGFSFDWQILKKYPSNKPFFLSGGIGLEEIEKIKKSNLPVYAVDVNSKFEIEPGLKNIELLKNIQL